MEHVRDDCKFVRAMESVQVVTMIVLVGILLLSVSEAAPRKSSLFQLSFEEVVPESPAVEIKGAAPANTFPLVLAPLNFAPAVVPPSEDVFLEGFFHSGSKRLVKGSIPLFKPLKDFPYIKYIPISKSFYLNEPNVRNPFAKPVGDDSPVKLSAPTPTFLPIRDTQVGRRPSKGKISNEIPTEVNGILFHNSKVSQNLLALEKVATRNEMNDENGIQIIHF